MRKAFTLIELMIVIAIIAIIAAIAVPNLLESRVTSQESAAATALKSGIFTAEVSFQAGGYSDHDGDGIGTYCVYGVTPAGNPYDVLSGGSAAGNGITLNLLAPAYRGAAPQVSGYTYNTPFAGGLAGAHPGGTAGNDGMGESSWGVSTQPNDNQQGRRTFFINQAGNVYSTKPANTVATVTLTATTVFDVSMTGVPATSTYIPYRR